MSKPKIDWSIMSYITANAILVWLIVEFFVRLFHPMLETNGKWAAILWLTSLVFLLYGDRLEMRYKLSLASSLIAQYAKVTDTMRKKLGV